MSSISKPKILITWPLNPSRFDDFQENFQIDVLNNAQNRREEVLARIDSYDGLLNMTIDVNEEVLEKSTNLKIIANYGVGYDNIDILGAQKRGIAVSNTPESTTNPTANHAIGLMLSLMRKISDHHFRLKIGRLDNWYGRNELGHSVEGKTLGIIGMGRIGKAVAKRALAFGMNIIYHNRNQMPSDQEEDLNARYVMLDILLQEADVISIHTPLNPSTKDLITKKELQMMRSDAYLINTARGGVINEQDLLEHLEKERIAGAGIDVFENEPHPNSRFFELTNAILTPHSGTGTHEARADMMSEALGNIMAFLSGDEMTSRIV